MGLSRREFLGGSLVVTAALTIPQVGCSYGTDPTRAVRFSPGLPHAVAQMVNHFELGAAAKVMT